MSLIINAAYLAWADTKARYKRSVLGPFWIVLTNLIGVLGLSLVWAQLFNQQMREFVPTVCIGLIVWQLVFLPAPNDLRQQITGTSGRHRGTATGEREFVRLG